jgi:membrane protein
VTRKGNWRFTLWSAMRADIAAAAFAAPVQALLLVATTRLGVGLKAANAQNCVRGAAETAHRHAACAPLPRERAAMAQSLLADADLRTTGGGSRMDRQSRRVITSPATLWRLARKSVTAWNDDYAPSMGAAISYYTVFSIAPLLLIVIAVAGLVLGREAATGQIFTQLQGLVGNEGAAAVQGMVKSASSTGKSVIATIVGGITLLIGATTVFAELQSALDRIWRAPAAQNKEGLWALLRARVLSFGVILAIGFLLLVSLVISAGLAALTTFWGPMFAGWEVLLQIVNLLASVLVIAVLFAIIYKYLPRVSIGWHDVWVGAIVTAVLFAVGKTLIGLYIGKSSVVSGFGAAGSLAVLLVWVYYSAQIFLLGAEFTWVYAHEFGSRKGEDLEAAQATQAGGRVPVKTGGEVQPGRTRRRRPRPLTPATDEAVAFLDRSPRLELGLAVVMGAVAAVAALMRGRIR